MLKEIIKVKDRVFSVLKTYPATRDSDIGLYLLYLDLYHGLSQKIGIEAYQRLELFLSDKNIPPPESVRRVRQKIQESGFFRGTKRKYRIAEEKDVRGYVGHNKENVFFSAFDEYVDTTGMDL